LIGNVYARYEWETEAQSAVDNLNDRWYAGKHSFFYIIFPSSVLTPHPFQAAPSTPNYPP
jgi:hypothetical protein